MHTQSVGKKHTEIESKILILHPHFSAIICGELLLVGELNSIVFSSAGVLSTKAVNNGLLLWLSKPPLNGLRRR
jgi:hypothetical protein